MTIESENKKNPTFSDILSEVISNNNYLVGTEPEGSGWDFSDWQGFDFREFKSWILGEKFFRIPVTDKQSLSMRIIQTDPIQFPINTSSGEVSITHVLTPVISSGFPIILIGKDTIGNEQILRNKRDPDSWHQIPDFFQNLANEVGHNLEKNIIVQDKESKDWANFLKDILTAKRIFPALYKPTDAMVRDQLEINEDEKYNERDMRLAEMSIIEQELLGLAYADFARTGR